MSALFRVSAKAVIIEDGRVLLLRKPSGAWDLPGGRLEDGESLHDALWRETREELGVPVAVDRLVHCGLREKVAEPDVAAVSFLCRLMGGLDDIDLSHEHEGVGLFARDETASITLDPVYREAVERAFETMQKTDGWSRPRATAGDEQGLR